MRRIRTIRMLVACSVLLVAAACGEKRDTLEPIGASEPSPVAPGASPALIETYWKVVSIDGEAVTGDAGLAEPHLILRSRDSALVGSTGVNRMFGSYELSAGGRLALHPSGLTRMAGPEPAMAQEQRLLARMREVDAYRMEGSELVLLAAGRDAIVLRATPAR